MHAEWGWAYSWATTTRHQRQSAAHAATTWTDYCRAQIPRIPRDCGSAKTTMFGDFQTMRAQTQTPPRVIHSSARLKRILPLALQSHLHFPFRTVGQHQNSLSDFALPTTTPHACGDHVGVTLPSVGVASFHVKCRGRRCGAGNCEAIKSQILGRRGWQRRIPHRLAPWNSTTRDSTVPFRPPPSRCPCVPDAAQALTPSWGNASLCASSVGASLIQTHLARL